MQKERHSQTAHDVARVLGAFGTELGLLKLAVDVEMPS
jgi:hypothetical protein